LENHRRRRDQIDIMGAFSLKAQYVRYSIVCSQSPGLSLLQVLTDLVILAKHTAKIASAKKNSARAFCSGNGRFFPKMQACMGNLNAGANPAKTGFSFKPVYPACARAAFTTRQLIC
ncbi:MAG: hypothetical protein Q8M34_04455, partial [Thermodesulfovibrionales bacterium]|nr:hypothetical protein [Thermodesulfovibrionales bacterium]